MSFVVFTAVKNEAPFLLEWVAYHQAIGFDKVIIVSNNCTDNTAGLLDALAAAGEIVHIPQIVPAGVAPQVAAAALANGPGLAVEGDWCIFLDADEFLNIAAGAGRVEDLVARIDGYEAILINWKRFGDSGNPAFTGRYISEGYCRAETPFPPYTLFKTFFRKSERLTGFSGFLHRCSLRPGAAALTEMLNGRGNDLTIARKRRARANHASWIETGEESWGRVWRDEIGYDIAQINHYIVRDPVSFALKVSRGNGHAAAGVANKRYVPEFYKLNNRNDSEDRSILRWAGAVTARMEQLCEDAAVAAAARQASADYAAAREALRAAPPPVVLDLPAAVSEALRDEVARAGTILEYGCGGTTLLAAGAGKQVFSVENDRDWARHMREDLAGRGLEAVVHYVNMGATGAWGFPSDPSGWANYAAYPLSVWDLDGFAAPDLVLINGRMRLACLAATALRTRRPVRVLFDDYARRDYYHSAEQFFPVTGRRDRMAIFDLTPGMILAERMHEIIPWFSDLR